jgi:hypothetical protein
MIQLLNQQACVRTLYTLAPYGMGKEHTASIIETKFGLLIEATLYDFQGNKIPQHAWNDWEKEMMEKIIATPRPAPDWGTLLAPAIDHLKLNS